MKKLVGILLFILFATAINAQTYVSRAFTAPNHVYTGGTTADTLYASDTLAWSIRVAKTNSQRMVMRLLITNVVGTVSDSVYFYGSFDGVTKDKAIDTIFNSNVSTGYKYTNPTRWANFDYPYILIWNWDKGGARAGVKSVRKLEIGTVNN
jgi:hypothetical protein